MWCVSDPRRLLANGIGVRIGQGHDGESGDVYGDVLMSSWMSISSKLAQRMAWANRGTTVQGVHHRSERRRTSERY